MWIALNAQTAGTLWNSKTRSDMKTNGEDMAFPMVKPYTQCSVSYGMTKREIIAKDIYANLFSNCSSWPDDATYEQLSDIAVKATDALIAALNKKGESNG